MKIEIAVRAIIGTGEVSLCLGAASPDEEAAKVLDEVLTESRVDLYRMAANANPETRRRLVTVADSLRIVDAKLIVEEQSNDQSRT